MQSVGIHDVLNAQGFAIHYRAILNRGLGVRGYCLLWCREAAESNMVIQLAIEELWVGLMISI